MLALLVPKPFIRTGWVFEEKYDGIRNLAYKEGSKVRLLSRNDLDRTAAFADIAAAVGLKNVSTGDTICDEKAPVILEAIDFPAEDLSGGLQRLGSIPYFWGFLR